MSVRDHLLVAERARQRRRQAVAGPAQHEQAHAGRDGPRRRPRSELVGIVTSGGHVGQRARSGQLPARRAGAGSGHRAQDPAGRRALVRPRPPRDGRSGGRAAHGAARARHGRAAGRARPDHGRRGGRPHRRHGPGCDAGRRAPSTRCMADPAVRDAYLGQMGLA